MAKVFKYFQQTQLNVEGANEGNKRAAAAATTLSTTRTTTTTTTARIKKRRITLEHYEILQNDNSERFSATNYAYAHVNATTIATTTTTATTATISQHVAQHAQLTTYARIVAQHLRFVALQIASTFCAAANFRCNTPTTTTTATTKPMLNMTATRNTQQQQQQQGILPNEPQEHVAEQKHDVRLPLKRKSLSGKTLQKLLLQLSISSHLDTRSLFYLLLIMLCYWCVLMHASTAAAAVPPTTTTTTAPPTTIAADDTNDPLNPLSSSSASSISATTMTMTTTTTTSTIVVVGFAATHLHSSTAQTNASSANGGLHKHRSVKRDVANVPEEEYDTSYPEDIDDIEALLNNKSAKGKYIGAPCNELKCDANLLHVSCDKETLTCSCERNYPVQLGPIKGCAKPKKLGEQCFYDETCIYNDENSLCVQVRHNALCQCANGFHSVSYTKPTRRVFCTQDLSELSSDLPTLLGVSTGIAVLAGLICMVLHLFSKTKYPRHRNFGDANIPPPILYSNETGIPLTVHSGRPSSRSSIRSTGSIGSYGNRRASVGGGVGIGVGGGGGLIGGAAGSGSGSGAGGSKGILVSTSRTGSRRPSLASVHSTSSSVRSYSMMRFEKEMQQKEIRQEMKLRLARLQQQQQLTQNKPQIIIGEGIIQHGALSRITMATPSPLTPNSLDELLPSVDETQEYPLKLDTASTSKPTKVLVAAATLTAIRNVVTTSVPQTTNATATTVTAGAAASAPSTSAAAALNAASSDVGIASAYIGPCSSSTEAL